MTVVAATSPRRSVGQHVGVRKTIGLTYAALDVPCLFSLRNALILVKIHLFTSTQVIGTGLLWRKRNTHLRHNSSPMLRIP